MLRNQIRTYSCITIIVSAFMLLMFKYFQHDDLYLAFFDDDFFYYVQTIKQSFRSGFITFDGSTATNGFHPLWFAFLSFIALVFDFGISLFVVVNLITMVLSLIVFKNCLDILKDNFNFEDFYSSFASLFISFLYLLISKGGMEIILTIPLLTYLIKYLTSDYKISSLKLGFIFSLCFLSRLDTVFFLLLLLIYVFKYRKEFNSLKFILGLTPSILYIFSNLYFYDLLMPISGLAKQLKSSYLPVSNTFESLISINPNQIIYSLIPLCCVVISLVLTSILKFNNRLKHLAFISISFPIIFLLYNSIVSGWGLWPWYYYIFIPSQIIFFILIYPYLKKFQKSLWQFNIIFIVAWSLGFGVTKQGTDYDNYNGAKKIQNICLEKDGVFAMGDRAGLVSFLIDKPIIQTEGLLMDKEFIQLMKSVDLKFLLAKYNVNYYISSFPTYISENKWYVEEPHKNNPFQIVCSDTLFQSPQDSVIVNTWKYYIFKMD